MNSDSTGAPLSERDLYGVLSAPISSINARVHQLLHRLRPGKHLSYVEQYAFDVDTFCFERRCERTPRADLPPVSRLIRDETGLRLEEDLRHGWFDVRWEG